MRDAARAPGYFGTVDFKDAIALDGWILAPPEVPVDRCVLYVDGEQVAETAAMPWPEAELPSYMPRGTAMRYAFAGVGPPFAVRECARVEVVAFARAQAVVRMGTFARKNPAALPTPPEHLMVRVTGNADPTIVKNAGARCAKEFLETLGRHRPLDTLRRVLDWGCGCGRVTMQLMHALAPYPAVTVEGCDLDAEAIAWANGNIRKGAFLVSAPHPPLPWPDATFDAVFACSVFTHLSRDDQAAWLREMQRVIAPGGLLLASIFSDQAEFSDEALDPILDGIAPSGYYRLTVQSRTQAIGEWSRWFDVAEFVEHGLEGVQHLIVMRRRVAAGVVEVMADPSSAFGTFSPRGGEKDSGGALASSVLLPACGEKVPKADEGPTPPSFPPGHFYSPIPDWAEVARDAKRIFRTDRPLPGIDLRADAQLELFHELAKLYPELPYGKRDDVRYTFDNPNFGHGDAIVLHLMLRHLRPRRVVEVGSGFSSCVTIDTNELFLGGSIDCTFIDPGPELLQSLLRKGDRPRILGKRVQEVPEKTFTALEANDVLFIDSSHVLKTGSDLNHLLFEVLPLLRSGVVVHFHDIFHPFEYPRPWATDLHLAWNEVYAVHAFLQYNSAFEIVFFNHYMAVTHEGLFRERMPRFLENPGGSLWIRRR